MVDSDDLYGLMEVDDDLSSALDTETVSRDRNSPKPSLFPRSFLLFCIGHIVAAIGQFAKVQLHGGSAGQVPGASGVQAASGSQVGRACLYRCPFSPITR